MSLWALLAGAAPAPLVFPSVPETSCPLTTVEIAMTGDVIMHGMQITAARRDDGGYRLDGVFEPVAPWLRAADLSIVNLETVTAGEDLGGYTGFPLFNSPVELLDALRDAGVDVLQTANNHCLDRGPEGLVRTLDAIDARGFGRAGTWRSPEERTEPWTLQTLPGGLRVAFLAYTFSTNAPPVPPDRPWLVNLTIPGEMEADIVRARRIADLVVVGMHWGLNYTHEPVAWVERMARELVAAGADIVMGHHPHVLEPAVVLPARDEAGRPRDALVLYSLGNFLSNQREPFRWGAVIARAEVQFCAADGRAWVRGVRFTPIWVDPRRADDTLAFRVVPTPRLGETTCTDPDLTALDCTRALQTRDHAAAVFGAEHLDWDLPPPNDSALGFDWTGTARAGPFAGR